MSLEELEVELKSLWILVILTIFWISCGLKVCQIFLPHCLYILCNWQMFFSEGCANISPALNNLNINPFLLGIRRLLWVRIYTVFSLYTGGSGWGKRIWTRSSALKISHGQEAHQWWWGKHYHPRLWLRRGKGKYLTQGNSSQNVPWVIIPIVSVSVYWLLPSYQFCT